MNVITPTQPRMALPSLSRKVHVVDRDAEGAHDKPGERRDEGSEGRLAGRDSGHSQGGPGGKKQEDGSDHRRHKEGAGVRRSAGSGAPGFNSPGRGRIIVEGVTQCLNGGLSGV